jgi:hypothetical protein
MTLFRLFAVFGMVAALAGAPEAFALGKKKPVSESTRLTKLPEGYPIVLTSELHFDRPVKFLSTSETRYFPSSPWIFTWKGPANIDVDLEIQHCQIEVAYDGSPAPLMIPAETIFTVEDARNRSHHSNLNQEVPEGYAYSAVSIYLKSAQYPQLLSIYCREARGRLEGLRVRDFNRLMKTVMRIDPQPQPAADSK